MLSLKVFSGRSNLYAFLFLKDTLGRCHGRPLVRVDRGPRYDWPPELLDCESDRETWGNPLLIEAWFEIFKYPGVFTIDFSSTAPLARPNRGLQSSPLSTMVGSNLNTLRPTETRFVLFTPQEP